MLNEKIQKIIWMYNLSWVWVAAVKSHLLCLDNMASVLKTHQRVSFSAGRRTPTTWRLRYWRRHQFVSRRSSFSAASLVMVHHIPTGHRNVLGFWEDGNSVWGPAGEVGQECLCGTAALLPQWGMPESTEVGMYEARPRQGQTSAKTFTCM